MKHDMETGSVQVLPRSLVVFLARMEPAAASAVAGLAFPRGNQRSSVVVTPFPYPATTAPLLFLQGGAVAARGVHVPEVPGSIPGPATNGLKGRSTIDDRRYSTCEGGGVSTSSNRKVKEKCLVVAAPVTFDARLKETNGTGQGTIEAVADDYEALRRARFGN